MGLQTLPGTFRGNNFNFGGQLTTLNLADVVIPGGASAFSTFRSEGVTLIDVASSQAVGRNWELLSVAIQAYLLWQPNAPTYGKIGKVLTAVDPNGQLNPTIPGGGPLLPRPQDATLTQTLWDPSIDDLPPLNLPALSVHNVIQLPVPRKLWDTPLAIGIWIEPCLIGCGVTGILALELLSVVNATYMLNFDDGAK